MIGFQKHVILDIFSKIPMWLSRDLNLLVPFKKNSTLFYIFSSYFLEIFSPCYWLFRILFCQGCWTILVWRVVMCQNSLVSIKDAHMNLIKVVDWNFIFIGKTDWRFLFLWTYCNFSTRINNLRPLPLACTFFY